MAEIVERGTPLQILFNLVLFLFLLYFSYEGYRKNKQNYVTVIIGILLFSVYSFWGPDYFHYKEAFDVYKHSSDIFHLEEVYSYILKYSPFYFVYRLIVWGGAFLLLYRASVRLGIDRIRFLFVFIALYLLRFSYARVTLAICMMVYGYSFLIKPLKSRVLSLIWGMAIIAASLYFHKSAVIIAIAVPLSFVRINKFTTLFALILLPVAVYYAGLYLYDYILTNDLITDETTLNAFNLYTRSTTKGETMGLAQKIYTYGEMVPVYMFVGLGLYFFSFKRKTEDVIAHRVFNFFFWAVFIATSFAFITPVIHRRMLFLAVAPMALLVSRAYPELKQMKFTRVTMYAGIIIQTYLLLYSLYLSLTS